MLQRITTLEQVTLQLAAHDLDKEKRLRFLERIVIGAAGAYTIISFVLNILPHLAITAK